MVNDFPPLRSLDAVPNNLPVLLTSFVGRDDELVLLGEALARHRLVTLTGAGGCGKTRLALQAATDFADRHPDGAWWIELATVSGPDLVPHAIARVFDLQEDGRPLVDTLCDQLGDLALLLVLDNCEHVLDASAHLVESLLRAAPHLQVLATSRQPLGAPGELTWTVPSLKDEAAVRLFVERANQVRPGFAPDGAETEVVTQICRRLDGIPLAIELAAARTRMMPPVRIAAGLDDRFRLLTGGGRTAAARHQTLEASVAWSYDVLDASERVVLRRLSVFAGGFTLDAAEAVCAGDPIDPYVVLELLSRLVDKSLVQVDHTDPGGRYRLLETIRLYADQQLRAAGESHATHDRHFDFFMGLAKRVEPELATAAGPAWLARLEREYDNLLAALEWAGITDAGGRFLRLVTALTLFFELRGHLAEGGRWFARALDGDEGPSVSRARALWGASRVAVYRGDNAAVARLAPEALAMGRVVNDAWTEARALNVMGLLRLAEPEPARAILEESVELARTIGDYWAVADGWRMITVAWMYQGDHDGAGTALEKLRHVAEGLGNKFFIPWYHGCAGWAAVHRGAFSSAREALETSLMYCHEVGDPATGGIANALLGELEALTGEYDAAEARLRAVLQRAAVTGGRLGVAWALPSLAGLALGRGDPVGARCLVEPLADAPQAYFRSWSLSILGAARLADGDQPAAADALGEAGEVGAALGNPWLTAQAHHHLGRLARSLGDTTRAEELHHEALALRAQGGLLPGVAESLEEVAALAIDHDSGKEAARLLGAASALRRSISLVRWPAEQARYTGRLDRLRQALGDADFEAAWSQGVALSTTEAVAYASRARGERKRPSTGWPSLTPTELAVVRMVAKGLTNPQIGERLFIGRSTVKTHLAHVFAKLHVTSRAELAAEATRRGL